ncbi:MAG: cache domain-containing protein, partial [Anaerolineae bacterium]|nr:cache domain-containing protein [Anaerolineae bacterium]
MRNSLRTRLIVAFIGLAVLPPLLAGIVLGIYGNVVQRTQALDFQSQIAQRVSADVAAFIHDREDELRVLTEVRALQRLSQEERAAQLSALLSYRDVYEELALVDGQGRETFRISRLETFAPEALGSRLGTDAFEQPKATGEIFYGPVQFDEVTGEPFMTIALPLVDLRSGQFEGVLVADFRFKTVWDLMAGARVSGSGVVYVIDAQDRVIAHRNPSVVLRGTEFKLPAQDAFTTGLGGSPAVIAFDRIELGDQRFSVVAEQPRREALSLAYNTIAINVGVIVLVAVLGGGVGLWIAGQIV